MAEKNRIKEDLLLLLKPLAAAGFLVLVVEAAQLILKLNYYHSYAPPLETLKLTAFFWLVFIFSSVVLSAVLASLCSLKKGRSISFCSAVIEILSLSAIFLVWIPAMITVTTKNFPPTVKTFWLGYHGLIPVAVVAVVLILRLLFKRGFTNAFANLYGSLWKPLLVLTVIAFIWVFATALTGGKEKKLHLAEGSGARGDKPNVILITFDALSARNMSLYGYHLKTTPAWEALAKESFVFDKGYSNANSTIPSVVSILTSKYPWTHNVFTEGRHHLKESDKGENLAALLDDHYTSAIVSLNFVYPPFLGMGGEFDFVKWIDYDGSGAVTALSAVINKTLKTVPSPLMMPVVRHLLFLNKVDGDVIDIYAQTFDKSRAFLNEHKESPFFLWTHIFPPHLPYYPPSPFLGRYLPVKEGQKDTEHAALIGGHGFSRQEMIDDMHLRYDEFVAFSDDRLAAFMRYLKESGLYDNSIIIISSDHGEMFEKGEFAHHTHLLAEAEIRVPLLIHLPAQREGRRIARPAQGVDIAPTILDLLGKPVPWWMEGESLAPYMKASAADDGSRKTVFSIFHKVKSSAGSSKYEASEAIAVIGGDYKLLYDFDTKSVALYNVADDKDELKNLATERTDIVRELWAELKGAVKNRELPD